MMSISTNGWGELDKKEEEEKEEEEEEEEKEEEEKGTQEGELFSSG